MSEKEKKDKRIGMLVSLGTHAVMVALFFFILAWKQPYPPKPEYGIELNIGFDQMGTGIDQPAPVEEVTEVPEPSEEAVDEVEQPQPEPVVEEQATETEPVVEQPEELPDSQQEDSPVYTEPEPAEQVNEPEQPEEPAAVQETVEESAETEQKEAPPPAPKINERALYPGTSQGPNKDRTGDAGTEDGTVDSRAIYGKSGGGQGGPSLDLAGWMWDFMPNPDDTSNENGLIVFEIKVDERGEVVAVRTLEKTVSATVELVYRREVERLTFSPTPGSVNPAPVTTGRITFIIRSK